MEEERTAGVVIYPCRGGVDLTRFNRAISEPLILEEKGGSALKATNWVMVGRWEADGGGGLKRGRPEKRGAVHSNLKISFREEGFFIPDGAETPPNAALGNGF